MQRSLLISSGGHGLLISFIMFSGVLFVNNKELVKPSVSVSLISTSEFDSRISETPKNILVEPISSLAVEKPETLPISSIERDDLPQLTEIDETSDMEIADKGYFLLDNLERPNVIVNQKIRLVESEQKQFKVFEFKDIEGNELNSLATPEFTKPKPRTADRIDKIAKDKSPSEKIVELPQKAVKVSENAEIFKETKNSEGSKESTTKIVPESKKNQKIVVSGAVLKSSPPPRRPKDLLEKENVDEELSKSSKLLEKSNLNAQIEKDLSNILASSEIESTTAEEVSNFEIRHIKSVILQKVEKNWNMGIVIGNSGYEDYEVTIAIRIDKEGKLVGNVSAINPKKPSGRYLRAFNQARNAILSAVTGGSLLNDKKSLDILKEDKFSRGLNFNLTFIPSKGFY